MLRWLSITWLLAVPVAPIEPGQAQLDAAQAPARFDDKLQELELRQSTSLNLSPQDLQELEADRVITPQENQLNGRDVEVRPVDAGCSTRLPGRCSVTKECSSGVVRLARPGRRTPVVGWTADLVRLTL